jgi:hypothetical protein
MQARQAGTGVSLYLVSRRRSCATYTPLLDRVGPVEMPLRTRGALLRGGMDGAHHIHACMASGHGGLDHGHGSMSCPSPNFMTQRERAAKNTPIQFREFIYVYLYCKTIRDKFFITQRIECWTGKSRASEASTLQWG